MWLLDSHLDPVVNLCGGLDRQQPLHELAQRLISRGQYDILMDTIIDHRFLSIGCAG